MRYLTSFLLLICTVSSAQKKSPKVIDECITQQRIQSHLLFLAADEMRGRNTGSPELDITANYIMTQFMAAGFFFQAEDGIRHRTVTGVQTCALPISIRDAV